MFKSKLQFGIAFIGCIVVIGAVIYGIVDLDKKKKNTGGK